MIRTLGASLALAIVVGACANTAGPPGGPPDADPPQLIRVEPDSGQVHSTVKNVVFAFDEVVSESPRGAQDLTRVVLVSPTDGDPIVAWHRDRITVHQRHPWRANTTYVVTLLPGVMDLRNNARDSTNVIVFTTGDSIAHTRVSGVVFDWIKGVFAPHAYVEAHPASDTTLRYAAEADSAGRFSLLFLPRGEYVVRALIDANHNRGVDSREAWDSAVVQLRDSVSGEYYAFPHDTIGPRITHVDPVDSVTIRVTFDKPLAPDSARLPAIEVRTADSAMVPIAGIVTAKILDERRDARARARQDSMAAADTTAAGKAGREQARRDSINRAAVLADSLARDTTRRVPPPQSHRPALVTEIGVQLGQPIVPGTLYFVKAIATGVLGRTDSSRRQFSKPKPAPAPPPGPAPKRTDTLSFVPADAQRDGKLPQHRR